MKRGDKVYIKYVPNYEYPSIGYDLIGHNCLIIDVQNGHVNVAAPDDSFHWWLPVRCVETYF